MGLLKNILDSMQPVTLTFDNTTVKVHNKKEAKFYAQQFLKISNDCAYLVNNTKNPKVFFERYQLLLEQLELLSKLEKFKCFSGKKPSKNLKEILDNKEATFNDFIERYYTDILNKIDKLKTQNAKNKKLDSFFNELSKYNDLMTLNNIQRYTNLYEKNR